MSMLRRIESVSESESESESEWEWFTCLQRETWAVVTLFSGDGGGRSGVGKKQN